MKLQLVVAACIVKKKRVLLVWHNGHKEWLPPGGHVDRNETPDDAVVREVREETGLEIDFANSQSHEKIEGVKRQLPLPFFADVHDVGDHNHCCFYYLAKCKNPTQQVHLKLDEVGNYRWFAKSELIQNGVPEDVKQISRLALTKSYKP